MGAVDSKFGCAQSKHLGCSSIGSLIFSKTTNCSSKQAIYDWRDADRCDCRIRKIWQCKQSKVSNQDFIIFETMQNNEHLFYCLEKVRASGPGTTLVWYEGPAFWNVYDKVARNGQGRKQPTYQRVLELEPPGLNFKLLRTYVSEHLDRPSQSHDTRPYFASEVFKLVDSWRRTVKTCGAAPEGSASTARSALAAPVTIARPASLLESCLESRSNILQTDDLPGSNTAADDLPPQQHAMLPWTPHAIANDNCDDAYEIVGPRRCTLHVLAFTGLTTEALKIDRELQPVRHSLQRAGLACELESGAKVLVSPRYYASAQAAADKHNFGSQHVVVTEDLVDIVTRAVRKGSRHYVRVEKREVLDDDTDWMLITDDTSPVLLSASPSSASLRSEADAPTPPSAA